MLITSEYNSNERSINMPSVSPVRPSSASRRRSRAPRPVSRFDQRLSELLAHATDVFDEKGYEGASMRDLSRASGMSLAGLYYYFESKEKLLYLIQRQTFTTILERLRSRLEGVTDPEVRIRVFIANHLEYFLANQKAMKVCRTRRGPKNGYGAEIAGSTGVRSSCVELMDDRKRRKGWSFRAGRLP
jgi:AcrR family transcriptional regulator